MQVRAATTHLGIDLTGERIGTRQKTVKANEFLSEPGRELHVLVPEVSTTTRTSRARSGPPKRWNEWETIPHGWRDERRTLRVATSRSATAS